MRRLGSASATDDLVLTDPALAAVSAGGEITLAAGAPRELRTMDPAERTLTERAGAAPDARVVGGDAEGRRTPPAADADALDHHATSGFSSASSAANPAR